MYGFHLVANFLPELWEGNIVPLDCNGSDHLIIGHRMVVSPPEDDVFNAVTRGVVHPRSHREVRALPVRIIDTKK